MPLGPSPDPPGARERQPSSGRDTGRRALARGGTAAALLVAGFGATVGGHGAARAQTAPRGGGASAALATFAGGCFWCMEPPFDKLDGVLATTSGYTGGRTDEPTYREVSSGATGHSEAVQIRFDPARVSYERLLEVFWRNVDPEDAGGQFCDRGEQYATAIFVHDAAQRRLAEASKARLVASNRLRAVVTPIRDATWFWPAEDDHQDYARLNPLKYRYYRWSCGRDARLRAVWGAEAGGGAGLMFEEGAAAPAQPGPGQR